MLPRPRAPLRPRIAARSPATRIVDGDFDDELVSDEDVVQTVDRTLATYLNAKQDVFSLQARAPEPPPTADVLTAERAPARGVGGWRRRRRARRIVAVLPRRLVDPYVASSSTNRARAWRCRFAGDGEAHATRARTVQTRGAVAVAEP